MLGRCEVLEFENEAEEEGVEDGGGADKALMIPCGRRE